MSPPRGTVSLRRARQTAEEPRHGVLAGLAESTSRPHELEKALGLHKTLAWKIAKIVECRDPSAVYQYLPGPGAINKFLAAAARTSHRAALDGVTDIDGVNTITLTLYRGTTKSMADLHAELRAACPDCEVSLYLNNPPPVSE